MLNKNRKNGDFAMGSPKTKGKLNNQFDEQIKATAQSITRRAALKKVRHRLGGSALVAWRAVRGGIRSKKLPTRRRLGGPEPNLYLERFICVERSGWADCCSPAHPEVLQ
jgi:hypothetical protein